MLRHPQPSTDPAAGAGTPMAMCVHTFIPAVHMRRPVPIEQQEFSANLSRQERMLLSRLSEAGKKGQWSRVKQTFGKYADCSAPVYNAAIAIKCPAAFLALAASVSGLHCQCKPRTEAANARKAAGYVHSVRGLPNMIPNPVTLHLAVRVVGKLRLPEVVDQIWNETKQKGWVDEIRAAGRIDAAAEMGDIVCAAEVLDYMHRSDLNIDINHFHSAMNACKNAEPPSPSAAMYLYKQLCIGRIGKRLALPMQAAYRGGQCKEGGRRC